MTNYIEFSAKIKEKYPQYADVDDRVLAEKMIEKYPEYKETVTFEEKEEPKKAGLLDKVNAKDYYADELAKRQEWEENHPIISNIQKDFQPGYRAQQKEMELGAKYGVNAPLKEILKTDASKFGQNLIPAVNIATGIATGGMTSPAKTLLSQLGRGAAQGAIQGGVLGLSHDIGDNGINRGNIAEAAKGAGIGSLIGGILPLGIAGGEKALSLIPMAGGYIGKTLGRLQPETLKRVVNPNSKALDLASRADVMDFATNLTNRVRDTYNNLLKGKGETISTAEDNLRNISDRVDVRKILGDIRKTFDQYKGDNINPARNMTGNLENDLNDLVLSSGEQIPFEMPKPTNNPDILAEQNLLNEYNTFKNNLNKKYGSLDNLKETANNDIKQNALYGERFDSLDDYRNLLAYEQLLQDAKYIDNRIPSIVNGEMLGNGNLGVIPKVITQEPPLTLSPIDLQKIKQQIGQMTNWADTTKPKIQNTVLEQIYGKMRNRLEDLSPELAQANKDFASVKSMQEKEGLKRILQPGDKVDSATSALDNFDASYNKGNTFKNVKDLEDLFIREGYEPFVDDIHDIVAAKDLNNIRTTGDSVWANIGTAAAKPLLKLARKYNASSIPNKVYNLKTALKGLAVPLMYRPQLQGSVEYNNIED